MEERFGLAFSADFGAGDGKAPRVFAGGGGFGGR